MGMSHGGQEIGLLQGGASFAGAGVSGPSAYDRQGNIENLEYRIKLLQDQLAALKAAAQEAENDDG
jgi:hypothetical protein